MKKLIMMLLALVAMFAFTACGNNGTNTTQNSDDNGYTYVEQSIGSAVLKRAIDGSLLIQCQFYYFDNENVDKSSFLMQKFVNDLPEDTVPVTAGTNGSKGLVQYTFSVYENEESHPLACAIIYLTADGVTQKRTVNKKAPKSN